MKLRWELVNDSAACGFENLPHPHKPRPVAWISVYDPEVLHRCMIGIERAFDYGKVSPELRRALTDEGPRPHGERDEGLMREHFTGGRLNEAGD